MKQYGGGEMSNPGNPFEQNPQQADQPNPGWYFAQGDPPGTERYWNGSAWEGGYRAVGGFSPTEVVRKAAFPSWAKVLAWILGVLKAIPLLMLAVLVIVWGVATEQLRSETDFEFREFSIVLLIIGVVVLVVGVVLLLGQLVAVTKEQPGRAAVWSGILSAIDGAVAITSVFGSGFESAGFFIGLFIIQGGLCAMMLKLWNDQKVASS